MTASELRKMARKQLGNNIFGNIWLMGIVAVIIVSAIIGVLNGLSFLVVGTLTAGLSYIFLALARGKNSIEVTDVFCRFKEHFGNTLVIYLLSTIFTFLWSLLFVIPGIVKWYSYSLAYYINIDRPELGPSECINESKKLMDGYKWRSFCLDLSFIGWYIVGSLCLGVGVLWVSAYHEAAKANFYCMVLSEREAKQAKQV